MKYRKKPIVIEAFQLTRPRHAYNAEWPSWLHAAWSLPRTTEGAMFPHGHAHKPGLFAIHTKEGNPDVSWDDWIIRGVVGELYSCKPDIFALTYDAVED